CRTSSACPAAGALRRRAGVVTAPVCRPAVHSGCGHPCGQRVGPVGNHRSAGDDTPTSANTPRKFAPTRCAPSQNGVEISHRPPEREGGTSSGEGDPLDGFVPSDGDLGRRVGPVTGPAGSCRTGKVRPDRHLTRSPEGLSALILPRAPHPLSPPSPCTTR